MEQRREQDPRQRLGFRLHLLLARLYVTFERAYPAFWPSFAVAMAFIVTALLGLFETLPAILHALLLVLFLAGFGWTLYRGWRIARIASADDGLRRLETDSRLRHQALRALGDELPPGGDADPATLALWQAHRRRLLSGLTRLRLNRPRSAMPLRDPWGFRVLVPLLLVIALVDARGDYTARLRSAFIPWQSVIAPAVPPEAALWITPPDYTRRPPLLAEQTGTLAAIEVPDGSAMLLQVHHLPRGDGAAVVRLGDQALPVTPLGEGSLEVRHPLDRPGRLSVTLADGQEVRGWDVRLLGDQPPKVAFSATPDATDRGVLRFEYQASDDYGLAQVTLDMEPLDDKAAVEHFPISNPAAQPQSLKSPAYLDLTANPRAGLPVRLTLDAVDGKGQHGRSETIEVTLPERPFRHPLARAVIELRKRFVAKPDEQEEVAATLSNLGTSPIAQAMGAGVPLSLHVAGRRTFEAQTDQDRQSVVAMLWDLALFIEDGGLSSAEREMRALQDKLSQALDQNANDQELEKLMQQLQEAMNRYLDELERKAMEQAQSLTPEQRQMLEQMQRNNQAQTVDRSDLQRLMDQARQMMRNGAKDQARQMLSQLQEMLENLQAQAGMPQQMSPQEQSLSDLQKMIQMQQQLLDQSFAAQRQQQEGQDGQDGQQGQQGQEGQQGQMPGQQGGQQGQGQRGQGGSPGQMAGEQEALRRALGELMRRMGEQGSEIPRSLGQAEMQMRNARDSLRGDQPGGAADSQSQALDLMQQAGQAMMQQMQQQAGNQPGGGRPNAGPPMMPGQNGRDPLGRAQFNNGGNDPRGATIPEEADLGRARAVLEQLYKRSGDRNRPQPELDYYRRLLDRF